MNFLRGRTSPVSKNEGPQLGRDELVIGHDVDTVKPVTFSIEEWVSHLWLPGAPGTGKTSFMELLLRWLLSLGEGFLLLDPIGVLFNRIVTFLSWHPDLAENVVILGSCTRPYWLGVNPFQQVEYITDPIVHADLITDAIKKGFHDDATMVLFERKSSEANEPVRSSNLSFAELSYFTQLDADRARAKIIANSQDEDVKREWAEFARLNRAQKRDEIGSLRNRAHRFIRNKALKAIMGRTRNVISISEIVEGRKQFLVDLSTQRGTFAQTHRFVTGALLLNLFAAYMTTRTPEQVSSTNFYTFQDEYHLLSTKTAISALDEYRNFSWRWAIAHQRTGQLLREDRDMLDAVLTGAGIRGIFGRMAPEALNIIEPLVFMGEHDLKKVKEYRYSGNEAIPEFYSLPELHYLNEVELFNQPRQHMTWKYLEEPPRRLKVADVQPYPTDDTRMRELIRMVVENHKDWYMHEDDAVEDIRKRHEALESSDDDYDIEDFADTNRANFRR